VHVNAEFVDGGLRITFANRGERPFLVNPVALGYGRGEIVTVTVKSESDTKKYRELTLELGHIRAAYGVPVEALRLVEPGGEFSWIHPVRDEHRDVGRVSISFRGPPLIGRAKYPVLTDLNDTWIR
jgi:hypothetical protein